MANIPLLLLAVVEIFVAATVQVVQYHPPPLPSGKTRKNPRTYHKYEGVHFSIRQCSEIKRIKNKPLEFCEGECDYLGTCSAFSYKEKGGKDCALTACGLNIPYPTGGVYSGVSAQRGWSGYTLKEITDGYSYYDGPYGLYWGYACPQIGNTLKDMNYVLCEESCDAKQECTGFNFNTVTLVCELRNCPSSTTKPTDYLKEWESWSKVEINAHPPKCPSFKCTQQIKYAGPYKFYWGYACPKIGDDLKKMNYVLCEEKCDAKQECTGFNFNTVTFVCELANCPSSTTIPTDYLKEWESWSKVKINDYPHKCPSFKCKNPRAYHKYDKLHFSSRQCVEIKLYKRKSLEFCSGECDAVGRCSAFNYREGLGECSLRACGLNPPYPIGGVYSGDSVLRGWSGYTVKEIPVDYTYYHGPYRNFFGHKTQQPSCGQLGSRLEHKSYVLCEQECDLREECTGFNFNIHLFKCELRGCASAATHPKEHLDDWEGWSKAEIKDPEPSAKCPSQRCTEILKNSRTYHEYENLHFSGRQCLELGTLKNIPIEYCAADCDVKGGCSAFNYKEDEWKKGIGECSLRACGNNKPYPIGGVYSDLSAKGWSGYTVKVIPVGFTYYHGPYQNFFSQGCRQLGPTLKYKNYVLCEEYCDKKPACTSFNFNIHSFDCELQGCSNVKKHPDKYLDDWEGWSKTEFNPEPHYKCPSRACEPIIAVYFTTSCESVGGICKSHSKQRSQPCRGIYTDNKCNGKLERCCTRGYVTGSLAT